MRITQLTTRDIRFHAQATQERANAISNPHGLPQVRRDQMEVCRDGHDELRLDSHADSAAQAVSQAMQPLTEWAGENSDRLLAVYKVGLQAAALAVGGPTSGVLGVQDPPKSVKDEITEVSEELTAIARQAREASLPILQLMVPESWKDEGVPGGDAIRGRLAHVAIAIEAGRSDLLDHVGKVGTSYERPLNLAALSQKVAANTDTEKKFEKQYEKWTTVKPWETPDKTPVAILISEDDQLHIHEGALESDPVRPHIFRLNGEGFHRNHVREMRVVPRA